MAKVGYIRVSTAEQNTDRQLADVTLDKVFIDHATGANTNRPQLDAMLNYIREGDEIIVHSFDRLARSMSDLYKLVETITNKGCTLVFKSENLTFNKENNPMSNLLMSVLGGLYQFELAISKQRQKEGIAKAKAKGVYLGRANALKAADIVKVRELYSQGVGVAKLAKQFAVSRNTIYKAIKTELV